MSHSALTKMFSLKLHILQTTPTIEQLPQSAKRLGLSQGLRAGAQAILDGWSRSRKFSDGRAESEIRVPVQQTICWASELYK